MNKIFATLIIALASLPLKAQDANTYYNDGVKLKNEQKTNEALLKFRKAIDINPTYTAALYELGWCQNETKDYVGAIKSLQKVRKDWPEVPKLHFELGFAFEKNNQVDSAIKSYNTCLLFKKDYSTALKQLGYINYNKGEYQNALLYFAQYEEASTNPIKDYLYWFRKGYCYNAQNNYEAAKIALAHSLEIKSDYITTYLELGFANTKLKLNDEAIKNFNTARTMEPSNHIPYNGIAEVYRDNIKNYDMAMDWYQKALAVKPDERKACYGMGYCLNSQNLYNEAIPYLLKAIQKESTYTSAYIELGYSNFKIHNYSNAELYYNKAIALNAKSDNAHYYLALLYIEQKEKRKAQMVIDKMKTFNSKNIKGLQEKINNLD